jgi:hypothetical protein
VGRIAKLTASKWHLGAASSIGITKERSLESRDDTSASEAATSATGRHRT